ncbi:MAG: FtsQ-type POTRA domain-containing protein [Lawsonibacter sp.]|nr:FtsQ-type POTRA domain-containing protein [Lawsonibacter sp.]MCI9672178.1 FtsQ-type POTRA domain-containing protein [Lawsonibacter sp.]
MPRYSHRSRTRRRNRGRFGPLFKLLCVVGVILALTVGATVFFRVEQVTVSGNQRYTQEEIIAASGIQLGDNLYSLNKVRIDQNIRTTLPYIGDLTINRALPSTIQITVTEWEAVAQVAAPGVEQVAAYQEEAGEKAVTTAQEPWLISVKGKLLEPAPPDSAAIAVTGLIPLSPQAGSMMEVPEGEHTRLAALTALLEALGEAGMQSQVSDIRLEATQLMVRYAGRFDVKMKLNADFSYDVRLMRAIREKMEEQDGEGACGSMDLTRSPAVYAPAQPQLSP